jgi:hypothetical protein
MVLLLLPVRLTSDKATAACYSSQLLAAMHPKTPCALPALHVLLQRHRVLFLLGLVGA